jgi:hypothetical protein
MLRYLRSLNAGRVVLWCYFIWYLVVLVRYFERNPAMWLTSFGLSVIIGIALYVNSAMSGRQRLRMGFWPTVRMFMMPFCVSSFSAMVKNRGFWLVFSPNPLEVAAAAGLCAAFCGMVWAAQARR